MASITVKRDPNIPALCLFVDGVPISSGSFDATGEAITSVSSGTHHLDWEIQIDPPISYSTGIANPAGVLPTKTFMMPGTYDEGSRTFNI
jgi:hypothetical protein